jgi:copper transport protein
MSGRRAGRAAGGRLLLAGSSLLLAMLAVLIGAAPAQAHASLVLSTPAAGSTVPVAPTTVRLTFSEVISVSPAGVSLTGPRGDRLGVDVRRDPADALSVQIALPTGLTAGTYTMTWNVLSIDGHPVSGAFRFAVIRASSSLTAPVSTSGDGPSALGAIGRVLAASGALALVGLVGFPWLVVRRVRRRLTDRTPEGIPAQVIDQIDRRLPRRAAAAAAVSVLGTALVLLDTAARSSGLSVTAVLTDPISFVITLYGRTGALLLARILLLTAAGAALLLRPREAGTGLPAAPGPQLAAALGFGCAGLLTFSLSSHAAAATTDRALAIGFDALHLLASAVWIGGLLALALVALPVARQLGGNDTALVGEIAGSLSFGFSVVAQLAMVAVLTTGGYAALVQVTGLGDLGQTSWGTELTAKLALWLTVLLIASFNAMTFIPRLASRSAGGTERLAAAGNLDSAIRLELVLAGGLVVAAALMSATAQPSQLPGRSSVALAAAVQPARTSSGFGSAAGYRVEVQVRRTGSGPAAATVFDLGVSAEGLNTGLAAPRPASVGVLRGSDGVDRAFGLSGTTQGRWASGPLSVSPGRYRLIARFAGPGKDGTGKDLVIPVELTVPA